jgi:hypothetical protein
MTPAPARPVVRPVGLPARRNRIRRATRLFTPVRAAAVFVMVLTALAIYGVGASAAFTYRRLDFEAPAGAVTTRDAVAAVLGLDDQPPNLILMRTDRYEQRLAQLPAVLEAHVTAALPDTIRVRLVERSPVIIWNVNGHRFLVDRTGRLYAGAASAADGAGTIGTVYDRRQSSSGFDIGSTVDPVDLDAATRLASLKPADIGSSASELRVTIEDDDGYVLQPIGVPWVAHFGVFTPSVRTPDLIPGQVRLLRSFLAGRELQVKSVTLADDRNGTWVAR